MSEEKMGPEKDFLEEGDATVVEFTGEDGEVFYYEEEMIIPVDGEEYALLVGLHDANEGEDAAGHASGCACGECAGADDEDVLIAKLITNADGEEEYIEPTDEEFAKVQAAYEALMNEAEQED